MPLLACAVLCLALLAAPAFGQGDPIMPLGQVERGMECEGRSVFRGTEIATFDVEILDVIEAGGASPGGILFRASGPALAETGLGFGFSGSPIYCPDSDGVARNIGAVSMSVDDYGNDVALATPIEAMLAHPAAAAGGARPSARRRSRPWTQPLMVSGIGEAIRRPLFAAAARGGIRLLSSPAGSAQVSTGVDLQPGSAVAAALSSGTIGLNAIGTVAYRDGSRIWAFGHPFEAVGARSLLLQGAFVHAVIGNPNPPGFSGLGTYKLASAGDVAGLFDFDGNSAVSGVLGTPPAVIPLEVIARNAAGEPIPPSRSLVADESPLNHPSGFPALSLITSIAVSDQALKVLGSSAGASFGRLCLRIDLQEHGRPLRFCNRYVGEAGIPGGTEIAMAGDAANAASFVENYDRSQLHVDRVRATLELSPGERFVRLRGASGPQRARRGQVIRVRLHVQRPRAELQQLSFRVRVPRSLRPGVRTLRLTGSDPDGGGGSLEEIFAGGFYEDGLGEFDGGSNAPTTIRQLARQIAAIRRYDGVRGSFRRPPRRDPESSELDELLGLGGSEQAGRPMFRHPSLRIGGSAKLRLRVR